MDRPADPTAAVDVEMDRVRARAGRGENMQRDRAAVDGDLHLAADRARWGGLTDLVDESVRGLVLLGAKGVEVVDLLRQRQHAGKERNEDRVNGHGIFSLSVGAGAAVDLKLQAWEAATVRVGSYRQARSARHSASARSSGMPPGRMVW